MCSPSSHTQMCSGRGRSCACAHIGGQPPFAQAHPCAYPVAAIGESELGAPAGRAGAAARGGAPGPPPPARAARFGAGPPSFMCVVSARLRCNTCTVLYSYVIYMSARALVLTLARARARTSARPGPSPRAVRTPPPPAHMRGNSRWAGGCAASAWAQHQCNISHGHHKQATLLKLYIATSYSNGMNSDYSY